MVLGRFSKGKTTCVMHIIRRISSRSYKCFVHFLRPLFKQFLQGTAIVKYCSMIHFLPVLEKTSIMQCSICNFVIELRKLFTLKITGQVTTSSSGM